MTTDVVLGHDLLRALTAVIELGRRHADHATTPLPWSVVRGLQALLVCQVVSFWDLDHRRGCWSCIQQLDGAACRVRSNAPSTPGEVTGWLDHWWSGLPPPDPGLLLPMPCEPGRIRWVSARRLAGQGFSQPDRLVADLLRPHLHDIWWRCRRSLDGLPALSPREWEILHLVGQGLSNSDVARRLFLSTATVRKHLEHVYDKAGLRSRTAAAAALLPMSPYAYPYEPIARRPALRR